MEIFIAFLMVVFGLIMMTFGWNVLVDGAVSLAKKFKISEAIIGLTIVAVGTSVPELVVSVLSALGGSSDIAIGNVIGSNIANIFLVLGVTAIITPIVLKKSTITFDLPVTIFTIFAMLLVVSDVFLDGASSNIISRIDAIIFLIFAFLYILYSVKHNNFIPDESQEVEIVKSVWKSLSWITVGIVILFLGGQILVDGAVSLAKTMWVSEAIIGLTVVAIGTSAPEMVTSFIAAKRWNPDIAVGNIIGSSVMNVFVILGVSALITPMNFQNSSFIDLIVSLFAPIFVLFLATYSTRNRFKITRISGVILTLFYILYLIYLVLVELKIF